MTGFRAEFARAAAICAALLICASDAAAQAQVAGTDGQAASGPPAVLGAGSRPVTTVVAAPKPTGSTKSLPNAQDAIQVAPLGTVDGPPAGLLDSTNGGLGSDIWRSSERSVIEDMLARMPLATAASSIHALARRLLLTVADAPSGVAPQAFLSVRLQKLLDAGMLDDAGSLAAKAAPGDNPELARLAADAMLFAGHTTDACGNVTTMRMDSSDRFWIELRAYCYAVNGDQAALDLTRAVMKSQGLDDKPFDTLLDDFTTHGTQDPGDVPDPTALHLALLQSAGLPANPGFSAHLGMPANVIAMRDEKDTPLDRLHAAEDAVRAGAATPDELTAVADAQSFTADQLAHAAASASAMPFVAGQALIRQATAHETNMDAKTKLIFAAFRLAEKEKVLPVSAVLQASAASAIEPKPAMNQMTDLISRALMLGGRPEAAARWYNILDFNSPAEQPLERTLEAELNLAAPDPERAIEASGALSWFALQATQKNPPADARTLAAAALILGLYGALGEPMPDDAKAAAKSLDSQPWPGRRAPPAVMDRLEAAKSDSGRKGEAIAALLDFIGPGGPGDLAPDVSVRFVRFLVQMGLPDSARALALDALLLRSSNPAR